MFLGFFFLLLLLQKETIVPKRVEETRHLHETVKEAPVVVSEVRPTKDLKQAQKEGEPCVPQNL